MINSLAALTLALLSLPGVGRRTVFGLLSERQVELDMSAEQIVEVVTARSRRLSKLTRLDLADSLAEAERIVDQAESAGCTLLDFEYLMGTKLATLKDPPVILFAQGDISLINGRPTVLIIGTREPTPYSAGCAAKFAQRAVESGFCTASGLADGCDTAAHEGTLEAGGRTIAVLPSGIRNVFPRSNNELAARVGAQGLLVSEYACDQSATRYTFVERDRLQAGISDALILVQSSKKGGSMHACREMLALKRPIAVLNKQDYQGKEFWAGNDWLRSQPHVHELSDAESLDQFFMAVNGA